MICPICNNYHLNDNDLNVFFNKEFLLCYKCYSKLIPIFEHYKINGCDGLAIFQYEGAIKEYLFQFKGQYDIRLAPIFIERFILYLSILYEGYTVVYIPSYQDDDIKRGFNHVELIFDQLKLYKVKLLYKTQKYKQSEKHYANRHLIENIIAIDKNKIVPKKVLLVDDVMTSGCSLSTGIKILRNNGAKVVKTLVMSKVCRYMSNDFF